MNILHIDCSPRPASHRRQLSAAIVEKFLEVAPSASSTRRDVGTDPVPHATPDYATTFSSPDTLAALARGKALSTIDLSVTGEPACIAMAEGASS